jgi:hypothetical protein
VVSLSTYCGKHSYSFCSHESGFMCSFMRLVDFRDETKHFSVVNNGKFVF